MKIEMRKIEMSEKLVSTKVGNKETYLRIVRDHLRDVATKVGWAPNSYPCTAPEAQRLVLKKLDLARKRITNIDPNNPVAPQADVNGFYENESGLTRA